MKKEKVIALSFADDHCRRNRYYVVSGVRRRMSN